MRNAQGSEIYVPKIPSYRLVDLAKAIDFDHKHEIVGIRPGEKLHEEMISHTDAINTYYIGKYYIILPNSVNWDLEKHMSVLNGSKVNDNICNNSETNDQSKTIQSLREKINNIVV